jgi:hypothetical protein
VDFLAEGVVDFYVVRLRIYSVHSANTCLEIMQGITVEFIH